ncbi:MAG: PRC-barrel domain-containing protein [Candidatus Syntropharchaeia archaeon]
MSRIFAQTLSDKKVMSIDGVVIGTLENIIVDMKTGELIDLVVKPDIGLDTTDYRMEDDHVLLPFDSVRAIKDFISIDRKRVH